jgi:hypothetical protein
MRFRYVFLGFGCALVLLGLLASDPDSPWLRQMPIGGPVVAWFLSVAKGLVVVALAHCSWKALHDYPEADGQRLYRQVAKGNTAAGLALVSRAVIIFALFWLFGGPANATESAQHQAVPARALTYLPMLGQEISAHWPGVPQREYMGGLIEHESCVTLTSARCWSPTSRLKTQREEGAGFGQITRAWRQDGSVRFDALAEMRNKHAALSGMSWKTIYSQPRLQLRAVVLKMRDNFQALANVAEPMERLAMSDAAYNGGLGGVNTERRACGLRRGCDPQRWWGHVEFTCMKSRTPLYGTRSACDINRNHVRDVLRVRAPVYRGLV